MVPALLIAFKWHSEGRFPKWRVALATVAAIALIGFAYLAPDLPLDNLATRLKPETKIADLCVGKDPEVCLIDVVPEFAEGEHWAVLVDLAEAELWVDALNERVLAGGEAPTVLASAKPEDLSEFRWTWGPSFEIREVPEPLMRPLYRELPRSFLTRDGVVVLTSRGLPSETAAGTPKKPRSD